MQRIYLIGYRGTGKSTVGRALAQLLGWHFVDADVHLEHQVGRSIRDIFTTEGESYFRDCESVVIDELSRCDRCVIATGGGVILRPAHRTLFRQTGYTAWLTAEVSTIATRLAGDATTAERRPALTVGGVQEIAELLGVREPWYRESADCEVPTDALSPDEVAVRILSAWTQTLPPSH